jgi:outer membrane protein assembly factor BamB
VLEYNGEKYAKITDKNRWYYRVVAHPNRGKVLFGQPQRGPEPFLSVIYEMNWKNSKYEPGKKIEIPEKISLMGFAAGDVMNEGTEIYIAFNRNDNICLVDSNSGDLIWKGREKYGGSTLSFVADGGIYDDTEGFMFFPMRTFIMDLDSDGKNEVITVNNNEVAGRVLKRFRKFRDAQIIALYWDGTGMSIGWETHRTSGFFRDFAIGDFNNDKKEELVAVLIIKETTLMGRSPKSAIIAYDISKN